MANAVTTQVLLDNDRNYAIKIVGVLDTGNLTDELIVDFSTLVPLPTSLRLDKLWYSMGSLVALLKWDATTDVPLLAVSQSDHPGWKKIAGLPNNAGTGVTGDVLLTTYGYTAATAFSMVLWFSKLGVNV